MAVGVNCGQNLAGGSAAMAEEYDSLLELYKESIRLFRDVSDIEKVSLERIWSGVHGLSCLPCMNSFLSNSCVFAHIYTTGCRPCASQRSPQRSRFLCD